MKGEIKKEATREGRKKLRWNQKLRRMENENEKITN